MIQKQFNSIIKVIRSDSGQQFLSSKMSSFLKSKGCLQQCSCTYNHQQNGIVERKHRFLLETVRALKFQSQVPAYF